MASLFNIQRAIAKAIASDPAIEAVCQAAYGKSITVSIDIDLKALPSANEVCPWAGISVPAYERPSKDNGHTTQFTLDSAVYIQDARIEQDIEHEQIMILRGSEGIEILSDLVYSVIEKCISTSPTQQQMTYLNESDTRLGVTDDPELFASFRTFTVGMNSQT